MIGIYKITNPSGKIYIGQSVNIKRRFKSYLKLSDCKAQTALYKSFIKYGVENHKFEIITECNESELNNLERYYQDLYDATNSKIGLNCRLTASNDRSGKMSKDSIERNRNAQLKRFENENERIKNGIAQKKRFENSEEIEKNRQRKLDFYSNGGKPWNKGLKGIVKASQETKNKMSESHKKRYQSGYKSPMKGKGSWNKGIKTGQPSASAKMVINNQNGFIYASASEALIASGLKIGISHFCAMIKGRKTNKTNFEYIMNDLILEALKKIQNIAKK